MSWATGKTMALTLLFILVLLKMCQASPASRGAECIAGTQGAERAGGFSFSLSPDGRRLAFVRHYTNPFQPSMAVADIDEGSWVEVGFDDEVRELGSTGQALLPHSIQWLRESDIICARLAVGDVVVAADIRLGEPQWSRANQQAAEACLPLVLQESRVTIRDCPPAELPLLSAEEPLRLVAARCSPDLQKVAFLISNRTGSFVAPPRAFLAERDGYKRRFLGRGVYGDLMFTSDSKQLLAYGQGRDQGNCVLRWRL